MRRGPRASLVRSVVGAGLVALAFAAAVGASGGSAAGTKIVFSRGLSAGVAAIFTIDADGSGLRKITYSSGSVDLAPAWSPDGRSIVFQRSVRRGSYGIWVMSADGSHQRLLARDGDTPSWSPDGRKIVFSSGALQVINVDGSGRRGLGVRGYCADWSPDGGRIAFTSTAGFSNGALFVMRSDGTGRHQLARVGICPSWSPDGRRLAYTLGKQGGSERVPIWLMNADGTGARLLRSLSEEDGNLAWSPDGRRIAFTYRGDIYVMNANGGDAHELARGLVGSGLSWQQSG